MIGFVLCNPMLTAPFIILQVLINGLFNNSFYYFSGLKWLVCNSLSPPFPFPNAGIVCPSQVLWTLPQFPWEFCVVSLTHMQVTYMLFNLFLSYCRKFLCFTRSLLFFPWSPTHFQVCISPSASLPKSLIWRLNFSNSLLACLHYSFISISVIYQDICIWLILYFNLSSL